MAADVKMIKFDAIGMASEKLYSLYQIEPDLECTCAYIRPMYLSSSPAPGSAPDLSTV